MTRISSIWTALRGLDSFWCPEMIKREVLDTKNLIYVIRILNRLFSRDTFCTGERQYNELETVDSKRTSNFEEQIKPRYNNPEIQALANEFGGLLFAGTLEIELHRLLEIVPRNRKRADAYKGLCSELRKFYGVDLIITSAKTKRENYGIERN